MPHPFYSVPGDMCEWEKPAKYAPKNSSLFARELVWPRFRARNLIRDMADAVPRGLLRKRIERLERKQYPPDYHYYECLMWATGGEAGVYYGRNSVTILVVASSSLFFLEKIVPTFWKNRGNFGGWAHRDRCGVAEDCGLDWSASPITVTR